MPESVPTQVPERQASSLQLETRLVDERRSRVQLSGATQIGKARLEGRLASMVLHQGMDIFYTEETLGGRLQLSVDVGPALLRLRAHRDELNGSAYYAADTQLHWQSANMTKTQNGLTADLRSGVGVMHGYGALANRQAEARILPFVRTTTAYNGHAGLLNYRIDLTGEAVASFGVGTGQLPVALDSTRAELGASLAAEGHHDGFSARLSSSIDSQDASLYLTTQAPSLRGALDAHYWHDFDDNWTLSAQLSAETLRGADIATPMARVRGMTLLATETVEFNLSGAASTTGDLSLMGGVGVVIGPLRMGIDAGAANFGPSTTFSPQGMLTIGLAPRSSRPQHTSARHTNQDALDARTRRVDSHQDTSHRRVFDLLAQGDIGALSALRDIQGAYGWVAQDNEAAGSQTEQRGAGDCSDQATLWSYYVNRYGSAHFKPFIFRYQREDSETGHALLLVRHEDTGKVYAVEYGHLALLQNVPRNASPEQIADLAREQLTDTRDALANWGLREGATSLSQDYYQLPNIRREGAASETTSPTRAISLRGADALIGRDTVFGD